MSDKEIKIRCGYQRLIPFGKAKNFQGELAELTEKQAAKLRNSIKQHGFVTPVFVWVDPAGAENILDGHQRLLVIDRMIKSDGYAFEQVPVVDIYADSKTEATEMLLELNSTYGKITPEGLYKYGSIHGITWDMVLPDIELPQIDSSYFADFWSCFNRISRRKT